ncbi:hypothetical protein SN35N_1257 [Lactiplantibacillus plantarum]|nr:hypothetical protein SN35N_1257 [Lactiplantibacillus plantarum]
MLHPLGKLQVKSCSQKMSIKKKRNGYNYGFVGIDIKTARITTLHVKTTRVLHKK